MGRPLGQKIIAASNSGPFVRPIFRLFKKMAGIFVCHFGGKCVVFVR